MNICIPTPDKKAGGLYTFLANWRQWLDRQGIPYTNDIHADYDVLFTNSFMVDYGKIARAKRRLPDLRVIQRMDGAARDYNRTPSDDNRQAHVNMLADLTIFQSQYARYATREKFKLIHQDGPVIYNPVDLETFTPEGEPASLPDIDADTIKVFTAAFSTNPMKGTWKIGQVAAQNPDVAFVLAGNYPDMPRLPNMHYLGYLEKRRIAAAARVCDFALQFIENEACPNVILEAMATGLPVLYADSGATSELVGEYGAPVTIANFRSQLDQLVPRRRELGKAARQRIEAHFAPEHLFPQYLAAIEQSVRRPLPTAMDYLNLLRQGYPVIENPFPRGIKRIRSRLKRLL